jgi:hypothetical protein
MYWNFVAIDGIIKNQLAKPIKLTSDQIFYFCLILKNMWECIVKTISGGETVSFNFFLMHHLLTMLSDPPNSKSKLHYNWQLVGQSVLVSGAHLGPATNFSISLKSSFSTKFKPKSKSKSHCGWWSVRRYVFVSSPNLVHLTRDFFFQSCCLVFLGCPL